MPTSGLVGGVRWCCWHKNDVSLPEKSAPMYLTWVWSTKKKTYILNHKLLIHTSFLSNIWEIPKDLQFHVCSVELSDWWKVKSTSHQACSTVSLQKSNKLPRKSLHHVQIQVTYQNSYNRNMQGIKIMKLWKSKYSIEYHFTAKLVFPVEKLLVKSI